MKYCFECTHAVDQGLYVCYHPKIVKKINDPVTGKRIIPADCKWARSIIGTCGRSGKYWEGRDG